MYWGEDEGDDGDVDVNSPGGIVIEALTNIRTVASLTLEEQRATSYEQALEREVPHPHRNNLLKGESTFILRMKMTSRLRNSNELLFLFVCAGGTAGVGQFM